MKKSIFVAFMLLGAMCVSAQEASLVNPLNIQLTQFVLDSVRANNSDLNRRQEELLQIQKRLKADTEALKAAAKELKDEQALQKSIIAGVKESNKHIANMDKLFQSEQKEISAVRKMLSSQLAAVRKADRVHQDIRQSLEMRLEQQQKALRNADEDLSNRQAAIQNMKSRMEAANAGLTNLQAAISQKVNDLTQLQATNKTQLEAVAAELKTVAAQIKASK